MRTLILVCAAILTGYIIGNLETKKLEEILEDLLRKGDYWLEVIQEFIGETIEGIEGMDSDTIQMNIDAFVNGLTETVEEFIEIESSNDKIAFIEERITVITADLLKKVGTIEAKNEN